MATLAKSIEISVFAMKKVGDSIDLKSSQPLGEYDFGWDKDIRGDFNPGTNDLTAMEACLECGACSEEKFLESDQYKSMQTATVIEVAITIIALIFVAFYFCRGGKRHF